MVDITPNTALLVALQNQFAASRANAPQGNLAAGIPALAGQANGDAAAPPGGPGGLATGAVGGGVPSTATTGQSVANALAGAAPALVGGGLSQPDNNFLANLPQRESSVGFAPPAPGTAEGEIQPSVILSMLSGNPITMVASIARAIAGSREGGDRIVGGRGEDFGRSMPDFGLRESSDTLGGPGSFGDFSGRGNISNAGR